VNPWDLEITKFIKAGKYQLLSDDKSLNPMETISNVWLPLITSVFAGLECLVHLFLTRQSDHVVIYSFISVAKYDSEEAVSVSLISSRLGR
jgi:hypothetical protein